MTRSQNQALLWILGVVWISTAKADTPCPKGGKIHLASLQCFWMSATKSSWFEAQDSCRGNWGGDLASAESKELLNFIHNSFSQETTVWVWLHGFDGEKLDQYGIKEPQDLHEDSASQGLCPQLALSTPGRWRKAQCAGQYSFICENQITESLPSIDKYLTGLVFMTGVNTETHIHPLPSAPDVGQRTVEMMLFPGLWFSHAGQVLSVELVVQPSPLSALARVQILRPYCSPNHHLVPPGCSSLLNPFSFCSAVPLCNTTGGCSIGQYWCHLLEACVPNTSPCSAYDSAARGRHFTSPPRYPALPPFYHLVADLPLAINPSPELQTLSLLLPERSIDVYPDDIVAVQHTLDSGTFLHCLNGDASMNSPWRQSYLSFRGPEWGGWWEGGLTSVPQDSRWVDGVVCDLRILYIDTHHGATKHEDIFENTRMETTTTLDLKPQAAGPPLRSKFHLHVIHPLPDEKNQIHVQINVPTVIVVNALFGEKAKSSWSAPVLRTGVLFHPSCPGEVIQTAPDCKAHSHDSWFSFVTLVVPTSGVEMLSISVMDADSFQSVTVKVYGYEAVTGLNVEPHKCWRILTNTSQIFKATVETGSSIKFTWVIDNLENFAYEGESYSVMFKQPAEYKLQVTAANPVSSQSQQILLTADEMTPLTLPEFLFAKEVVAVDATHHFAIRVKVDISLPVTLKWDFGDGSGDVIHTQSAPCQTMEGLLERGEKQVYVHDSVNHTYSIPDDYTIHVQVSNQYGRTGTSMMISVRPPLKSLILSPSSMKVLVKDTFHLDATVEPPNFAALYTWDFGDASKAVQGIHHKISHSFGSAGIYNISVSASNGVSLLNTSLVVMVLEKISGLVVTNRGQTEAGAPTDFRATVASGTNLIWDFDFGDGSLQENLTHGSVSHIYKFPGSYRVGVSVSNSVSQAHKSITVEVHSLTVSGILPTDCVMSQNKVQFTALVNGNISNLTFHWMFEHSAPTVIIGQLAVTHTFKIHGIFHVNLTVVSSVRSVSFSTSICVESPITEVAVQSSQDVASIGDEVCLTVSVSPEQATGYKFRWLNKSMGQGTMAETSRKCFFFKNEGFEEVSVVASNKVSTKTAIIHITIQKPVSKIFVSHDSQSNTLMVHIPVSFWVNNCTGSNVSVVWDFGDRSPLEWNENVTHVFISAGRFTVTATAFNVVSRDSAKITVDVLLPVSDLSLHTHQQYAVVGEETLITAVSSAISISNYYWTIEGMTAAKKGTYQYKCTFTKPGVYKVRVVAQNLVSKKESAILIEVFERIEGPYIDCQALSNQKYMPTQEEIMFTASVTKGSNITYSWLATLSVINQTIRGNREHFHLMARTPGRISIQLSASNILGEATNTVSYVAIERVRSAHIVAQSNTVPLGKAVNISLSVDTGSDLRYFWYVDADISPLRTLVPFFIHTFTSPGHSLVSVSVQNVLSQSNDSKQFLIQEEVQEVDFLIDENKPPFFVSANAAASFQGITHKGNTLHWEWKVKNVKETLFTYIGPVFIHIFPQVDIFQVYLNASNEISWHMVSHNVTIQQAIKGLWLNISKTSFCTEEQVTFIPTISKGSNVSFVITFQKKDWIQSLDVFGGQLTISSLPAGTHQVTIKAMNQVSTAETSSYILVTESIKGLRFVNGCSATLEALKRVQFKAEVQGGFQVNYTWIFHPEGSQSTWLLGQEVIFTPPGSGFLFVSVHASNAVCSQTLNETMAIEWPARKVKLVCHVKRIFVGHAVRFSTMVNEGSNVRYLWDFGDSTEIVVTNSSLISHIYYHSGKYSVMVKAFNNVSLVSTQLQVDVEMLQCSNPQISLVQKQSTIFRSRLSFFEASVDINCSAYKKTYLWEIFRESCFASGNIVDLRSQEDTASPFLLLPKHALDVGSYCLVFSVSFQETPLLVQQKTNITVVHSLLVAVIKGGSHRLWSSVSDLVLDGSQSHDPDMESGVDDTLQYHWTSLMLNSTESPYIEKTTGSMSQMMIVASNQLQAGKVYIFTLTIHKNGRTPVSVNQTVTVTAAPVLPVTIKCVSCSVISSDHHISNTNPLVLAGQCDQCDDQAQYKWRAEDHSGLTLELNDVTTSTGTHSPNLVVRSGVLQPGRRYSFALHVSQPDNGRWGRASLMIQTNSPPGQGLCDLSPKSDIYLLETAVTYNCSGFHDDESDASQLIYTFQATSCQSISTVCPVLTLYRGTRSTFSSLVPAGSPGHQENMSVITVSVLVEDHLGATVTALNRTLTVINPASDKAAIQWLRNKSQTELSSLIQHGNPQEIIPYSIALTSKLNQMEFGWTTEELADRKEIWENVTQALISLPVSTLQDVDQLSSALTHSTPVSRELLSESCKKGVLEFVGKMIHVMKERISPTDLPSAHTGNNILSVIGSTLAAISVSGNGSSPHPVYRGTLQVASRIALSALGHAEALMRILMLSHVHGEAPLLLSTKYIKTVGFFGDPANLLCTDQSNQFNTRQITPMQSSSAGGSNNSHPCQFLIPRSLSAHLRSQRSEVVQVLLGIDGALDSNPLLSATSPPISTSVVAMKITTPQGHPIPIQDLNPEQSIRVTLPNKYPAAHGGGSSNGRVNEDGNGTCLTVTLPTDGQLNFSVKAVDGLDENAGLYISFNFSLAPGATPVSLGHVRAEVISAVAGTNASQGSLVREWALTVSAPTDSSEKSIFLSPLLDGSNKSLSVNLTSSLVDGGPVIMSVCVFSSLCQYYSVTEKRWSSEGLRSLEGSTLHTAHCLTQHLTMFGASLFVHPGAVVLLPPSGGLARNMVAGIMCAILVLLHLLLGLIAHKLDLLDSLRLSLVPLCGRPGLYHYRVLVKTGWRPGAGTTAHVGISLHGINKSGSRHLQRDGAFQRGSLDQFQVETDENLGEIWKIRIWHDNTGLDPSWYVQHVVVWDSQTDHMFFFLLEDWLSVENQRNSTVEKEVLASCPEELTQFQRVFTSQLVFGIAERHLWLSLWERPTHSRFTRAQRVSCSILSLHLYLALGALWYGAVAAEGQRRPVSSHLLFDWETVAVGMVIALLVFPLQCLLCLVFTKALSQVSLDMSVPPSPACHSVEMDVYLDQSEISGPSFLSMQDPSGLVEYSPTSLLESKALNSSILDFWTTSGLVPQTVEAHHEAGEVGSPSRAPTRQLRRKKALMQLSLASPSSPLCPAAPLSISCSHTLHTPVQVHNKTTLLTLSDEDLLSSIAAAAEDTSNATNSNSDSGHDSPKTVSSFSATRSIHCSSWSEEQSMEKSPHGAEISHPDPEPSPSLDEGGLYKCPSEWSVDSVASTFLPGSSLDSTRSPSTTRLGVARSHPSWLLPPRALSVAYPLVAALLGACLAAVGLYGSFFSQTVLLMWLISALSAFITSAVLLEPLKVCLQALACATLWRLADPEVEEPLAREVAVVKAGGEPGGKVRPPFGYGLLQAKEEARKVRALRSLMRHCVSQLFFLLLVLMVNYQDRMEQRQGRLLHSAVRRQLHTAPSGSPNLTSLTGWSHAEQWITHTLVPYLHQNPTLQLVGLPRLQHAHAAVFLGNTSEKQLQLLADMQLRDDRKSRYAAQPSSHAGFTTLSIDFTHYHRESGLFMCVSIQLKRTQNQGITPFLSIHPLLMSSSSGPDLHAALTILLLCSALSILFMELWSVVKEHAQYLCQFYRWFQPFLALWSLATAALQLCFLSAASSCVSEMRSNPDSFIDFHSVALLAESSSQFAAVLLTLLVLKLLGTLGFVRRWVMIGRVLQRAWRELWAVAVLLLLQLLLCTHLGNALFSQSVEGFLSAQQTRVSVLSMLRGRTVLQKLCRFHPMLGPLYGLLVTGGSFWILARLCGAVLIHKYREEQAGLFQPTIEPQDYEMVEFFIKRLKLWMGITKTKQFRHRVKFEGMAIPPSRSSQDSSFSTLSSTLPSSRSSLRSSSLSSPSPMSSEGSVRSEDPSYNLETVVNTLLSRFDQVNQLTEDIHSLEIQLEEVEVRRRKKWITDRKEKENIFEHIKPKELDEAKVTGDVRRRKVGLLYPRPKVSLPHLFSSYAATPHSSAASSCTFPRVRKSYSESESLRFHLQPSSSRNSEAPTPASGISGFYTNSSGFGQFPRRRAWHSGSSHSADVTQRPFQLAGTAPCRNGGENSAFENERPRSEKGVRVSTCEGVPLKRKAWISDG